MVAIIGRWPMRVPPALRRRLCIETKVAIETASSTRATGIHDQWGWPSRLIDDVRVARLVTTKNATTATVTALNPPRMHFRDRRRSAPLASSRLPVAGTGTVVSVFEAIESELGGTT